MKKIVLALAMICVAIVGRSQTFEGVIHWSMKMEITDPKVEAQMKELQAKMNDPQFKAMMEANPQMKAAMSAMGGGMATMMPTGIEIKLKGNNSLLRLQGGIMDKTDVLRIGDKNTTYTINNSSKTYMVMKNKDSNSSQKQPKITKTTETQKILGYTCTKYVIEQQDPSGKTTTINYWATSEIKDLDLKELAKLQQGQNQSLIFTEIDGVPLKVENKTSQANVTMECTDFKKESVPASTFVLPAGYTEQKI